MKSNKKGMSTIAVVVVIIVVIAIVAGVGAWYFMGGDGDEGAAPDKIKIGWPTSLSGPISTFGEGDPWIAEELQDYINNEMGGIYLSEYDQKVPVEILIRDTESDSKQAASVAEALITKNEVDLMLVLHTPDVVNPVTGVSEKHGVPTIALDNPLEAWLEGAPYEWSYCVFWQISDLTNITLDMWEPIRDQTNEVIGGLWEQTADGVAQRKVHVPMWEDAGYEVVNTDYFPTDMQDFSAIISKFQERNVEIISGVIPPPAFHRFMRQCQEMEYHPKAAFVIKGTQFPASAEALGDLAVRTTFELEWTIHHPYNSSLTGESAEDLCLAFEEEFDKHWIWPIGYGHAGIELAVDVLERAGTLEPEALRESIANTDMTTIIGPVDFKDSPSLEEATSDIVKQYREHVSLAPVVGAQWVREDGEWKYNIVTNWKYDEIPETAEIQFPLPWAE